MNSHTRCNVDYNALSQRPLTDSDIPFIRDLYCTSRDYEVANSGWPEDILTQFLQQQFMLQHQHYSRVFDQSAFRLIEYQGSAIGRLYRQLYPGDIRLIDITLHREFRQCGIGSYLIRRLQQEADQSQCKVSLHVVPVNPALKLYLSLGFKQMEYRGGHIYMEYNGSRT